MIRSMTGFGTAEGAIGGAHVTVEVRSVNHRFFSPSIKLPSPLARWEPEVRDALRRSIARGHVTVTAWIDRTRETDAVIDEDRFSAYVERLRDLKQKYLLEGPIDLATVLRLPDVISAESDEEEGSAAELVAIVERALASLSTSREAEGRRLAVVLTERLTIIDDAVHRLAERAP